MHAVKHEVTVTVDASGDATTYTSEPVNGRIFTCIYTKDDFANGVDFTITTNDTAQNVWVQDDVNASATIAPRQATHSTVGVASLYAGSGEPVEDHVVATDEHIKIVIASGGNATSGTFTFITG